ncbi:MAG: hypothetical protein ACE5EY_18205, partial [Anaerolineae bacterium]
MKGGLTRAGSDLQRASLGLLIAALISIGTFRLAQPYAFADPELVRTTVLAETGQEPGFVSTAVRSLFGFNPQWRANMEEIQHQQGPEFAAPFALQWTDRAPILFPLTNMVLYGMGLTAGIAAWAGFLWALWRIVRGKADWMRHAIPVAWAGFYFLFMGTRWVKSIRYFLPIYPMLFLLAGWALFAVWNRARQAQNGRLFKQAAAVVLIVVTALPSFLWANTFITTYTTPFTRIRASEWIFDHVPSGATLLYEANGQQKELQLPLKQFEFINGGSPLRMGFTLPEDGTVTAVRFNYLSLLPEIGDTQQETLRVELDNNGALLTGEQTFTLTNERQAIHIDLPDTVITADSFHNLTVNLLSDGPLLAETTHFMTEAWDDLLPVGVDGRNAYGSYYTEVFNSQRPVTDTDSMQKRQDMVAWLDEADYVILSSQRAMWSQPRLPISFPMMMVYYDSLFNGSLGFEMVSEFHADFHVGPLTISDTTGQVSWGKPPFVGFP